jgi:hypothetical protein
MRGPHAARGPYVSTPVLSFQKLRPPLDTLIGMNNIVADKVTEMLKVPHTPGDSCGICYIVKWWNNYKWWIAEQGSIVANINVPS